MTLLTAAEVRQVIEDIEYKDWVFEYKPVQNGIMIWPMFQRVDSVTGYLDWSKNMRPWYVEYWRDKGYLVQTIFKMIEAAEEHELRETFKYKGEAIYGPHRVQSSITTTA